MAAKKKTAKRKVAARRRKPAGKRELIDTGTSKRYMRRNARGTSFTKEVSVGRSLAADRRSKAKRKVAKGQGDKGDVVRSKRKR